ncbi:UNC93-like protein [Trichonephila inaurata madagascariensis]|uniref:UNC93-like protein n=1 Tax=Trichonephila inaurata madagascariensis TaxID=2747483 RepID=A0A8X6XZG1_9ARAC|nr:UNC93-like protein [Trichonephila inaurata madagascariensis]
MMEEEPAAFYVEDNVTQPLLISNNSINSDPSGSSSLFLSALRPRDHQTMSKKRIVKNVLVLNSSFFIFFLGFQSLSNLQSTMNSAKGIGMESQAAIYAASMVSSLLLPEFLIKTFGCKRTIVFMFLCSVPYLISNFNPTYEFIMPCSILMGIAIGPLNTAGAFYVNEMSFRYQKITLTESMETILARFFGLLSFFLENTQIWGNLVSYYILRPAMIPIMNHTNTSTTCGIDFEKDVDGNGTNPNLQPPSDDKRYLLVSMYVLSAIIAATLMGLFLDKLENDVKNEREEKNCKAVLWRLLAAAKQATLTDQILLLPITILCGLELAFYTGEITEISDLFFSGGSINIYIECGIPELVFLKKKKKDKM